MWRIVEHNFCNDNIETKLFTENRMKLCYPYPHKGLISRDRIQFAKLVRQGCQHFLCCNNINNSVNCSQHTILQYDRLISTFELCAEQLFILYDHYYIIGNLLKSSTLAHILTRLPRLSRSSLGIRNLVKSLPLRCNQRTDSWPLQHKLSAKDSMVRRGSSSWCPWTDGCSSSGNASIQRKRSERGEKRRHLLNQCNL